MLVVGRFFCEILQVSHAIWIEESPGLCTNALQVNRLAGMLHLAFKLLQKLRINVWPSLVD
jgi:hypothetical protein